jgi:hypothetical protein
MQAGRKLVSEKADYVKEMAKVEKIYGEMRGARLNPKMAVRTQGKSDT